MLARSFRLGKKEIKRLYKKGQTRKIETLTLRYLPNRAKNFRAAIVIPKAVVLKSTDRNRLKRKTLEILAQKNIQNFDIAFIFRAKISEGDLESVIENALKTIIVRA